MIPEKWLPTGLKYLNIEIFQLWQEFEYIFDSKFSTVTLVDEGYVTGASGQRILAGIVDISGQPSGTSMRWKLALANNRSKVHGVSLSWA